MDYFEYKNNILHAEEVNIKEIAEEVGTPFYCYSSATLRRHVREFAKGIGEDINKKICFAVKANSNVAVLKVLASEGCGADVVSGGEIRLAMKAGIQPSDIIFSGVGKTSEEIKFAIEKGVSQFNVESKPELDNIQKIAASTGKNASIAIRVNPDIDAKTHAKISTGKSENKFGIPINEAPDLYDYAASLSAIKVRSISMHIGSQLTDLEPFAKAFEKLWDAVLLLEQKGHSIESIDLGGGLGIPYDESAPPLPEEYGKIVRRQFKDFKGQLIFEPGRLIAGNAGILVSSIIYMKEGSEKIFLIADAAMNDLLRPSLYEAYHDIVPVVKDSARSKEIYDIVGPVCETGDTFAINRSLQEMKPEEMIAFRSCGAYGAVMSSTYNARPLAPEILVDGKKWASISPRVTYEEMIDKYQIPEWME